MFQEKIEKALSKLTGQQVRMEKFKLSPFSGSLEIIGLRIGELLQIRRISGNMSMAKALAKEIAIKSMTIEGVNVRLTAADLKPRKISVPSGKEGWSVTAEIILLRDLAVHLPERELSFESITGEMRREGADVRFEFDIGALRRKDQQVNQRPIHGTGSFSNVADLTAIISSRMQMGLQWDLDVWKLLGF
jgi:hypothetical protein